MIIRESYEGDTLDHLFHTWENRLAGKGNNLSQDAELGSGSALTSNDFRVHVLSLYTAGVSRKHGACCFVDILTWFCLEKQNT